MAESGVGEPNLIFQLASDMVYGTLWPQGLHGDRTEARRKIDLWEMKRGNGGSAPRFVRALDEARQIPGLFERSQALAAIAQSILQAEDGDIETCLIWALDVLLEIPAVETQSAALVAIIDTLNTISDYETQAAALIVTAKWMLQEHIGDALPILLHALNVANQLPDGHPYLPMFSHTISRRSHVVLQAVSAMAVGKLPYPHPVFRESLIMINDMPNFEKTRALVALVRSLLQTAENAADLRIDEALQIADQIEKIDGNVVCNTFNELVVEVARTGAGNYRQRLRKALRLANWITHEWTRSKVLSELCQWIAEHGEEPWPRRRQRVFKYSWGLGESAQAPVLAVVGQQAARFGSDRARTYFLRAIEKATTIPDEELLAGNRSSVFRIIANRVVESSIEDKEGILQHLLKPQKENAKEYKTDWALNQIAVQIAKQPNDTFASRYEKALHVTDLISWPYTYKTFALIELLTLCLDQNDAEWEERMDVACKAVRGIPDKREKWKALARVARWVSRLDVTRAEALFQEAVAVAGEESWEVAKSDAFETVGLQMIETGAWPIIEAAMQLIERIPVHWQRAEALAKTVRKLASASPTDYKRLQTAAEIADRIPLGVRWRADAALASSMARGHPEEALRLFDRALASLAAIEGGHQQEYAAREMLQQMTEPEFRMPAVVQQRILATLKQTPAVFASDLLARLARLAILSGSNGLHDRICRANELLNLVSGDYAKWRILEGIAQGIAECIEDALNERTEEILAIAAQIADQEYRFKVLADIATQLVEGGERDSALNIERALDIVDTITNKWRCENKLLALVERATQPDVAASSSVHERLRKLACSFSDDERRCKACLKIATHMARNKIENPAPVFNTALEALSRCKGDRDKWLTMSLEIANGMTNVCSGYVDPVYEEAISWALHTEEGKRASALAAIARSQMETGRDDAAKKTVSLMFRDCEESSLDVVPTEEVLMRTVTAVINLDERFHGVIKPCLKALLNPCAYYPRTALQVCTLMSGLYPRSAAKIAERVSQC